MGHDERMFIRRRPGERYQPGPAFTILRHTGLQRSVMVWGVISYESLEAELVPYTQQLPGHIFQQNDARPHVAQPVIESLNRIEHVWDMIGRLLIHYAHPAANQDHLWERIERA
nr:unnamed protein product [Callosobruchus analis]